MTSNRKIIQFSLISIGVLLILATYFLYPKIEKNKLLEEEKIVKKDKDEIVIADKNEANIFEHVEYKGIYNIDTPFVINSDKANITKEEPDIVYMTNMSVILHLNDGRTVTITSDRGRYNKVTYDCYFENNVRAADGESLILAENLDLLSNKNTVSVYNDVVLTGNKGSLQADKINYDLSTRKFNISMFGDKKVKIKLIR
jgi:LPS export ABC transporter protein LptC